jgi:hypothetical protein
MDTHRSVDAWGPELAKLDPCPRQSPTGSIEPRCGALQSLDSAPRNLRIGRGPSARCSWRLRHLASQGELAGGPCECGEAEAAGAAVVVADGVGCPGVVSEPVVAGRAGDHGGAAGAGLVAGASEDGLFGGLLVAGA